MAGIGETLKEARERKGLTIAAVSQATKINPKVLSSLEAEEFDKMAGALYVKSFLRKYSEFLGLNSKELISSYLALNPQQSAPITNITAKSPKSLNTTRIIRMTFLILVGCVFLSIFFALSRLWITHKRAFPKIHREKRISSRPLLHSQALSIPQGDMLRLKIKARKNTWLQLKADGDIVFQQVLPKAEEESRQARDNFELWVGDASNLILSLNGKPLGSLGRGVKRGIVIDHEGLKLKL